MTRLAAFVLTLAAAFGPAVEPAIAQGHASPLIVQNAWMRSVPGADTAAVYLVLRNTGVQPVIVIGVRSPVASHVMIHETSTANGTSQMRMHDKLVVAPGQSVSFQPGGLHIMLSGLKKSVLIGQTVPLVLLTNDGQVQVAALVRPLDAQ
ncbi:MAG: copper chaperone PCu(A)C [Gammaproteobacteria bacterium]